MGNFTYSAARHKTELTKHIIRDELPFTTGESESLRDYASISLNPSFTRVSRQQARNEAIRPFNERKAALKADFQNVSKLAITSDIWTTKWSYAYICITAHYIDAQWMLQKCTICLKLIECPHTGAIISSEISKHVHETPDHFAVLEWWKRHDKRFPVLSNIARDLLMVPVSTVASESCFSASSRMLSDRRSRLKPDILEAIVCVQDWMKADRRTQNQKDEEDHDVHELDLESLSLHEGEQQ
ncbi:Uncharacterized protein M6B38_247925 [Iris pallida]|uniref:HAT C-terminal dimerisation domain-containing protein n=1 Tax=Iris pallida TaxID=29817 RepID=A0AAX6DG49_IRIPA|nr:Uncharacterized protein M6B38_247925 [Iris pallida]